MIFLFFFQQFGKPEDFNNPSSAALGALWNTQSPYANMSVGQAAAAQQYAAASSMMPQLAEQLEKGMVINDPAIAAAHKRETMQNNMLADMVASQGYMGDPKMSPIGQPKHPFVPTSIGGSRGRNGSGMVHGPMSPGLYNYISPMMQPGMDPLAMSPTQIAPPSQYLPQHLPPGFSPDQATVAAMAAANHQHHLSYPHTALPLHSQDLTVTPTPGTPTLAPPMPPSLHHSQGSAQGLFSPPNSITHSPVQILGHTLSTSIFSPPPSAAPAHGMFINNPGKPSLPRYELTITRASGQRISIKPIRIPKTTGHVFCSCSSKWACSHYTGSCCCF